MRTLFFLAVLVVAACSRAPVTQSPELPLYCLGQAQPRSAFLAANYQRLIPEVRAERAFVLNQADGDTVRVASLAEASSCGAGLEPIEVDEIQSALDGVRWQEGAVPSCTVEFTRSRSDPHGTSLFQDMGKLGLVGGISGVGDAMTVVVQDECSLAEPIIRALSAQSDG